MNKNIKYEFHRHTKVIWSIDSRVVEKEVFLKLASTSFDILRVLYAKDQTTQILDYLQKVRKHADLCKNPVMVDVSQCPRGFVNSSRVKDIVYGQEVTLSLPEKKGEIIISSKDWEGLFQKGAAVYLGCGDLELVVEKISEDRISARVVQGGSVFPGMEVFVPKTQKPPSIFDLGFIDIRPFQELLIDYVVLPGISSVRELSLVRRKLSMGGKHCPWIIVKLDSNEVYQKIEDILEEADGIMISRRELALTVDPALVPLICKEVIHCCNKKAKVAIVASEMLVSMRKHQTPTRAEVSDIANGVMDGASAVVLSADITFGPNSKQALDYVRKTIEDTEKNTILKTNWHEEKLPVSSIFEVVSWNAYKTAERIKAKAIVCLTKEGNTALRIAGYRPPVPIIALTFSNTVKRRLSLVRGVSADLLEGEPNLDNILSTVNQQLKKNSWLDKGDVFVLVTITLSSMSRHASNLFTIQKIQ